MRYYVDNGYPRWQETLNFLDLIAKWWSILNVKTTSKGKRKRDVNSQQITNDNLDLVEYSFLKYFNWLCEWQASGSNGLSDETFKTFKQTSRAFPLLARYLIEGKCLEYVLSGKITSDFIEKRFGRYRQLSGANYFALGRQFVEAEKEIRVKYSIKEVCEIMKTDKKVDEDILVSHSETIMDGLSENIDNETLHMDNNIIFYIAGFIARSLKKIIKCEECSNICGTNEEISMPTVVDIPEDCDSFLNSINRGGLIKPSDLTFLSCIASWSVYKLIMDNNDSKSYFLLCKSQLAVFVKCLFIHIKDNDTYSDILKTSCMRDHSFETIIKSVAETFFNVIAKNFVSDVNSITHSNKKRKSCGIISKNAKIIRLQSSN